MSEEDTIALVPVAGPTSGILTFTSAQTRTLTQHLNCIQESVKQANSLLSSLGITSVASSSSTDSSGQSSSHQTALRLVCNLLLVTDNQPCGYVASTIAELTTHRSRIQHNTKRRADKSELIPPYSFMDDLRSDRDIPAHARPEDTHGCSGMTFGNEKCALTYTQYSSAARHLANAPHLGDFIITGKACSLCEKVFETDETVLKHLSGKCGWVKEKATVMNAAELMKSRTKTNKRKAVSTGGNQGRNKRSKRASRCDRSAHSSRESRNSRKTKEGRTASTSPTAPPLEVTGPEIEPVPSSSTEGHSEETVTVRRVRKTKKTVARPISTRSKLRIRRSGPYRSKKNVPTTAETSLSSLSSVQEHLENMETAATESCTETVRQEKCAYCNKLFSDIPALISHISVCEDYLSQDLF